MTIKKHRITLDVQASDAGNAVMEILSQFPGYCFLSCEKDVFANINDHDSGMHFNVRIEKEGRP